MIHLAPETACCPLGILAQWALENTIGNLGCEVHQPSNPFMNLSEHGLMKAQINAMKALIPDFNSTTKLPQACRDLGDGYVLLTEKEGHQYIPLEGSKEELGIQRYLAGRNT